MVRYYCDLCGKEIAPSDLHGRLQSRLENITVKCMVAVGGIWNGGHVCNECIVKVLVVGVKSRVQM